MRPHPLPTCIKCGEISFVSKPVHQALLATRLQHLHIDFKKSLPLSTTRSRDEHLLPVKQKSTVSQDSNLQTPTLIVKWYGMDETSQHSEISDHSKSSVQMKEELEENEKALLEKEEIKKEKRMLYQQELRQNEILDKEIPGKPKKRPRKSSKVDYDSDNENVFAQLQTLPPMVVSEPVLSKNFAIASISGCGDMSKVGTKGFDARCGDLTGNYGNAIVPGFADFYNSKPYGDQERLPEKAPASTVRGLYYQEFPEIRFDTVDEKKLEFLNRHDTPGSIISSSLECYDKVRLKFPGLKLIDENEEEGSDEGRYKTNPIPLKPHKLPSMNGFPNLDKENINQQQQTVMKGKFGNVPLKESDNVTVTLTLISSAAEDMKTFLKLANILHIPAPMRYQIVEQTGTSPSQLLGLYRTKGKDGKEGEPIDNQSTFNGDTKFCRHCDVVIKNNMIRKVSELPLPLLSKNSELLSDGDEIYFCSFICYKQFALMHRSPSMTADKAVVIVKHRCQNKEKEDDFEILLQRQRDQIKCERMIVDEEVTARNLNNAKYKFYSPGCIQPARKFKKSTDKEHMELMHRLRVTSTPLKIPDDTRKCIFCNVVGDGVADGPARLLNFDVDKWVHLNCALWSDGVYETVNGALMNLSGALQQSVTTCCVHCNQHGATISCFNALCTNVYHLPCAMKDNCVFYKNKTIFCSIHVPKNEKDNELTTLSVPRRVYVDRDENRQVAAVMHQSDQNNLLRVGSLILLSVGQLLPHQLANFHTSNYIYPIGYKIIRFYWSMRRLNKRCRYICSIHDVSGRPEFRILMQDTPDEDIEFRDSTCKGVWMKVLEPIAQLRRAGHCAQLSTQLFTGEDLFGLSEPAVVRVLESLPGIETLTDYKLKYDRNSLQDLPYAINPTEAASSV